MLQELWGEEAAFEIDSITPAFIELKKQSVKNIFACLLQDENCCCNTLPMYLEDFPLFSRMPLEVRCIQFYESIYPIN